MAGAIPGATDSTRVTSKLGSTKRTVFHFTAIQNTSCPYTEPNLANRPLNKYATIRSLNGFTKLKTNQTRSGLLINCAFLITQKDAKYQLNNKR